MYLQCRRFASPRVPRRDSSEGKTTYQYINQVFAMAMEVHIREILIK